MMNLSRLTLAAALLGTMAAPAFAQTAAVQAPAVHAGLRSHVRHVAATETTPAKDAVSKDAVSQGPASKDSMSKDSASKDSGAMSRMTPKTTGSAAAAPTAAPNAPASPAAKPAVPGQTVQAPTTSPKAD